MMSDQVKEAAERLRVAFGYGIDIASLLSGDGIDPQLPRDLVTLASAYLNCRADGTVKPKQFEFGDWVVSDEYRIIGGALIEKVEQGVAES